jgi:hypothetical protein
MAERQGVEGLAPRVVQAEAMIHVPAGDHLQHGGSPHDEVEPCDRKVGKEYKTEKPKGEGERRDDTSRFDVGRPGRACKPDGQRRRRAESISAAADGRAPTESGILDYPKPDYRRGQPI